MIEIYCYYFPKENPIELRFSWINSDEFEHASISEQLFAQIMGWA